jgi:hypothetical protein
VERERQKPESPIRQGGQIEEAQELARQPSGDGAVGKVRNLMLEEVSPVNPLIGGLTVGSSALNPCPEEVRAYLAQELAG